jgi:DNA-binding transcriptional MerR regulator
MAAPRLPSNDPPVEPGSTAPDLLTIGQVVRQLQGDFPDISISKIRYLESRGLVSPTRSKGRYRKYTKGDVRTLRTVLTLQRDEYLPLDVIMQRIARAPATGGRTLLPYSGRPTVPGGIRPEEPLYSLDEVCQAADVDRAFVKSLEEYRLLCRAEGSGTRFTESDLEIVRVCHLLSRHLFEPRNLRLMISSAEREAAMIEQVATASLRSTHPDRRESGVATVESLGTLFAHLNQLLLYRELRRLL